MILAGVALRDITAELDAAVVKAALLTELRRRQTEGGYSLYWVCRRYRELTGEDTVVKGTMAEKRAEYERILAMCEEKRWAPGAVAHMYRRMFGVWPKGVGKTTTQLREERDNETSGSD